MKVDIGSTTQPIDIAKVEETYNCTYVGDFCLRTRGGGWGEDGVAIFYQADPKTELGHTHYMGVFERNNQIFLTCGDSAFEELIDGVVADNGDIIYSRFRHDYRRSQDGTAWIDGGRDYTRTGITAKAVKLEMIDGVLLVKEEEIKEENTGM